MTQFKISKVISIICSIIGLILSSYGLIIGLLSIGASGWGGLGVIFIMPSVIALLVILFDFLITLGKIKRGLIYSCINSIIKIGIIACFIPTAFSDYKYEMKFGVSNLDFDIIVIVILTMVTVPSILNIIKLIKSKKNSLQ
ncbi:MAG: hypothetical protein IJE68_05035 [Clostridia bacterium]|nr:hypothetical protein [Clostridia bacterium]